MSESKFCSLLTRQSSEPLAGTAPFAKHFVFITWPKKYWQYEALDSKGGFPEGLKEWMKAQSEISGKVSIRLVSRKELCNESADLFIYPEKKPAFVQKKIDKAVAKSIILSKKDFSIAKAALESVDKKKWQTAIKLSKKAKDKMVFKLVYWLYLKEPMNNASFYDYLTFINNNPNYPRINRLKYLAEHKIYLNTVPPSVVMKWFDGKEPLSDYGKIKLGEAYILVAYLTTNLIASVYVIARQWDGLRFLKFQQPDKIKELVHFGKYSMGTLIGSSLLKSADTFIIGLSPVMGATAIAMYAIPLKLTDLLGIPLRSLTMTAYPKLSRKVIQQDLESARKTFYAYSGAITLAFIPIALVSFIFAEELILFLGGSAYRVHLEELTLIFRVFTVYTILLPIDRFTGVMLDSANQPRLNMRKVIVMTLANIVMNLIAVFAFESLLLVAVGTVLFTLLGMGLGFYYLHRVMQIKPTHILPESIHFFKNLNSFLVR